MMYEFVGGPKHGMTHESNRGNLVGYIRDTRRSNGLARVYYRREGDKLVHKWSGPSIGEQFRNWYKQTYGVTL